MFLPASEMSGDDVLREIREIRSDAPVLLSSGFDEQDVSRRFAEGGPSGFIQKPYLLETPTRKIREILEG